MSRRTDQVLERARLYADQLGQEFVATDHLLAAVGEIDGAARDVREASRHQITRTRNGR